MRVTFYVDVFYILWYIFSYVKISDQKHYTNVEKKNQNKIKGIPNSSMIPESHNKK